MYHNRYTIKSIEYTMHSLFNIHLYRISGTHCIPSSPPPLHPLLDLPPRLVPFLLTILLVISSSPTLPLLLITPSSTSPHPFLLNPFLYSHPHILPSSIYSPFLLLIFFPFSNHPPLFSPPTSTPTSTPLLLINPSIFSTTT